MKSLLSISVFYFLIIGSASSQTIKPLFPINAEKAHGDQQALFEEVKSQIMTSYYTDELTEDDLYWAAIQGMLRHISPPSAPNLATIWTHEEHKKVENSLKGINVSLGIKSSYDANTGSLLVTGIEENSSAEGMIQKYDRILRIDGEALKGKSIKKINEMMNGPEGSQTVLTINRDVEILKIKLKRKAFGVKNLEVSLIPSHNTALIEIHKFYLGLNGDLDVELAILKKDSIQNIIFDLRHNTGGVLNEGVQVANLFLSPKNIILRTKSRSTAINRIGASRIGYDFNMVTLIDENTASASEIVVSALQDHKRSTIIGTKSYGKGVIETTYKLSDDYRVKFITSAMYSATGKSWQSKGLLPDFLVEQNNASYNALKDQPIQKRLASDIYLSTALKLLK